MASRLLLAFGLLSLGSCSLFTPMYVPPEPWTTSSGIVITDLLSIAGPGAVAGQEVSIHYTASLSTGTTFDSSYDLGAPIRFTAGMGQVPPGFDEGVLGMTLGSRREITVPPALAYGEAGVPGLVPPDATITFLMELMELGPAPPGSEPDAIPGD